MDESKEFEFVPDREQMIPLNVDALGHQWKVVPVRGQAMVEVLPPRKGMNIPKEIDGKWTRAAWLQDRITDYVTKSWDKAEASAKKAPARERAKKAKEEKAAA